MEKTDKKFWLEFIHMYKARPVLWNLKLPIFKNRRIKAKAYSEMVQKLRTKYADANVDMVKLKIENLLENSKRERQKRESVTAGGSNAHVPLFCYDELDFLADQDQQEETALHGGDRRALAGSTMRHSGEPNFAEHSSPQPQQHAPKRKKDNAPIVKYELIETDPAPADYVDENEVVTPVSEIITLTPSPVTIPERIPAHIEDHADILGKIWAFEYRGLSKEQRLFAKKAIDDILFEGKLNTLHRRSVRINDDM